MLSVLVSSVLVLTALDHWSTWLCLRSEVHGWTVTEANPISDYLFGELGLVGGLALDTFITVAAITFILHTPLLPRRGKLACLSLLVMTTGFAVVNNLSAIEAMGLWSRA
jgi:hypothetical protein